MWQNGALSSQFNINKNQKQSNFMKNKDSVSPAERLGGPSLLQWKAILAWCQGPLAGRIEHDMLGVRLSCLPSSLGSIVCRLRGSWAASSNGRASGPHPEGCLFESGAVRGKYGAKAAYTTTNGVIEVRLLMLVELPTWFNGRISPCHGDDHGSIPCVGADC